MITAITFQFTYNKKYLNDTDKKLVLGESSIGDLVDSLYDSIDLFTGMHKLIYELNKDLDRTDIAQTIHEFFPGVRISTTNKTKKIRTHFFAGLTIHEQDQN